MSQDFGSLVLHTPDGAGQYFDQDIQGSLEAWAGNQLHRWLLTVRGDSPYNLAAIVLLDGSHLSWESPLGDVLHFLGDPDDEQYVGPDGLFRNVAGKLRYTLRTGRDSSHLENNPHLALPGDFPYMGAIRYRGMVAGVSGLPPRLDVEVARLLINEVVTMRDILAQVAIGRCHDRTAATPADVKYLGADPVLTDHQMGFAFV